MCDNIIGNSNYDIGHLLVTVSDAGGFAEIASVCASNKASAVTFGVNLGYYGILIHEMGHQFGATHTFNVCGTEFSKDQRNGETSVEPAAGTTIMSYSGGCTVNLQSSVYLYFHSVNIEQIRNFVQDNGNCASVKSTGNTPPTADAGDDVVIPKSTPFLLEGTATDPDNSTLKYTWEQIDPQLAPAPPNSTATQGPAFRWLLPTTEPNRYMPNIGTILNGKTENTWEVVPSVSRELNFVFLVRDNDARGGETSADKIKITVDGNSGPFLITSDNSPTTWYSGQTKTIYWDVANTNIGAVNTPTVDVLFSTDGGITYPTTVASDITNDGSYSFEVSSDIITRKGRFMIKGHNNIFLDVNNADIIIEEKEFLVNIRGEEKEKKLCSTSSNSISYDFTYNSYLGFEGTVNFSASDLDGTSISFSPASTSTDGANITMTINNISSTNNGANAISITATSGSISFTDQVTLSVYDSSPLNAVNLISPSNGTTNLSVSFAFRWNTENNANSYRIEISTDSSFSNIIEDAVVSNNSFVSTSISYNTTHYWHIKPINSCVNGSFSTTFSFTTGVERPNDTFVPDDNFEQALIDFDLDSGALDNYVSTQRIKTTTYLDLRNLHITDLTGIEDFTALTYLSCFDNQLTNLDVSKNTALTVLECSNNQLTTLDVSANTVLTSLGCHENMLKSLDLSKLTLLTSLVVGDSSLSFLNIKNGNNDLLTTFYIVPSPLTCIQVDDKDYRNTDWSFDKYAILSEDCYDNTDIDNDGILYINDTCPNTPSGESINTEGCSKSQIDTDGDGVFDNIDQCNNTPSGESINKNGCSQSQIDTDEDGVPDHIDRCNNTRSGESVNENGCS